MTETPADDVIYVGLGNSDNKLTQVEWAHFQNQVLGICLQAGQVIGVWFSAPVAEFQNACYCVKNVKKTAWFKKALEAVATDYRQDSISFAEAKTTLIGP